MALLHDLHATNLRERRDWTFHVAHLNHQLRAEADADAEFVRSAAAALGLPCTVESADVGSEANRAGETVEEAGRRLRYAFFERVANRIGAQFVALAHHADDQAETILHRILRGAGLRGLRGMPVRRPIRPGSEIEIIRPLLGVRRGEIIEYIRHNRIEYRIDATNAEPSATRNRIRHELLPLAKAAVNPQAAAALLRLADQAARADDAIRAWAESALNRAAISRREGAIILNVEELTALPPAVHEEIILTALRRMIVGLKEITAERVTAAAALFVADGARRIIQLPGATVIRRGAEMEILDQTSTLEGQLRPPCRAEEIEEASNQGLARFARRAPGNDRRPSGPTSAGQPHVRPQ